jgi:hypothetical protein
MYLKVTIQRRPIFADNKRLSGRIRILAPQTFFLPFFYLYFLSCLFILSGYGMVGETCGGKKDKSIIELSGTQWLGIFRNF